MRKSVKVNKEHNANITERRLVSFQCDRNLWNEFDNYVVETYGNYKKSLVLESLIRREIYETKIRNSNDLL